MAKPLIQIDHEVREMTDEELAMYEQQIVDAPQIASSTLPE
jgi:hypothetical protein